MAIYVLRGSLWVLCEEQTVGNQDQMQDNQEKTIAIVQARYVGGFKQEDDTPHLAAAKTNQIHDAFGSRLNITSDRLNMSYEKENKNDAKVLGLSNWMKGD